MTQDIRYRLAVDGAQETAAGFDKVNDAMARQAVEKQKLASQDAAGQAFLSSLREQAALYNKTADDALRYRAAQLGVAQAAGPLILQLQNQRAAHEEAAAGARKEAEALRESAAAKRASENAQASFVRTLKEQAETYGKSQAEILRYRAAQLGIGQGAEQYIQQIERQTQATGRLGASVGQTRAALSQLPAQFTDIFTSLAGGQSPLLVFIQQGGQIKDSFGGIRNAAGALLGLLTPVNVGVGLLAATLIGLGSAAISAGEDVAKLNRALSTTGNAAGLTETSFNALAASIADATGTGIGTARDVLLQLVETGRLSGRALEETAKAALRLSVTGVNASDAVKRLSGGVDDVASAAASLTKQYNFLNGAQLDYIKSLQDSGDLQGAQAEAMRLLNERIGDQSVNLSGVARAWKEAKEQAQAFAEATKSLFRGSTVDEQLREVQRQRAELARAGQARYFFGPSEVELADQERSLQGIVDRQREAAQAAAQKADADRASLGVQKIITDGLGKQARQAKELADTIALLNRADASPTQRIAAINAVNAKYVEQAKVVRKAREERDRSDENIAQFVDNARRKQRQDALALLERERDAAAASLKSVQDRTAGLQDEEKAAALATLKNISLAEAIEEVAIARLREQQARLQSGSEGFEAIEREIAARRQLQAELGGKAQREAIAADAKAAGEAYLAEFDRIRNGLTDALIQGGRSAKDLLVNLFRTLVLRPILDIPARAVAGVLAGAGSTGALAAGSDALGLANVVSNLGKLPTLFSNGFSALTGGFQTGILRLGDVLATSQSGLANTIGGFLQTNYATLGSIAGTLGAFGLGRAAGQVIGGGFGFGNSGNSTINLGGAAGAAIGSIVPGIGTAIGAALGAAVGGLVNRLFGRKLVDSGIEGTLGAAGGFSGQAVQRFDGGLFRSDKTVREALDPELQALLSGSVAGIKDATAAYAAALGLPVDGIKSFTQEIRLSFKDLSQDQVKQLVSDALTGFGKALVEPFRNELAPFIRAGEDAGQTLARLADSIGGVNPVLRELGVRLFDVGLAGADAAQQLIDGFGGASGFASSASSFYQKYFTEAERAARGTQIITEQLGLLGLALPGSREEFRRLVEVQDLTTTSGRQAFTALLGVSDAFDEIQRVAEGAGGTLQDFAAQLREAIDGALPKFLSPAQLEARSYEQIVAQLQAAGVQATIATLRDASKTQIFDFAAAFVAAGSNSEAAKVAVVGAASALADLKDAASQLRDEVAGKLQGAIESALPKFLSPAQQQERQFQKIVAGLQTAGVQATVQALRGATKDEIFSFAQAFVLAGNNSDAAKLAVVEAASALADLKDASSALTDSLTADIRQFLGTATVGDLSPLNPQAQFDAARQLFDTTLARARSGDADARGNLVGNARTFLEEAKSFFGSTTGFASIFSEVQGALASLLPEGAGAAAGTTPLDVAIASQASLSAVETSIAQANSVAAASGEKQVTVLLEVVANQRAQIAQVTAVAEAQLAEARQLLQVVARMAGISEQTLNAGVPG